MTVLEKHFQIGGCLQCFYRDGVKFETGMHFIGSADKGQTMDMMFKYLEVDNDVAFSRLDKTGYDIVLSSLMYMPQCVMNMRMLHTMLILLSRSIDTKELR